MATRSIYDGRVHAEVELDASRPGLILVRPSTWEPAALGGSPTVRALAVDIPEPRVRTVELIRPSGDLDLTRADVIFSVGRGVGSQENVAVFAEVAAKFGAALGASRPIVDAGEQLKRLV